MCKLAEESKTVVKEVIFVCFGVVGLFFFWRRGVAWRGFFFFILLPDIVRKDGEEGISTDLNKLTSCS